MYMFFFSAEKLRTNCEKFVASFKRSIGDRADVMLVPMRVDSPAELFTLICSEDMAKYILEFRLIRILLCTTGSNKGKFEGYLKMGGRFYEPMDVFNVLYPDMLDSNDHQLFVDFFKCYNGATIERYLKTYPEIANAAGQEVFNMLANIPRDKIVEGFLYKNRWYHSGLNPEEYEKFLQYKAEEEEQGKLLED